MRSNTNSILYQLSKHGLEEHKHSVLTLKSVREMLRPEQRGTIQADHAIPEANSRPQCDLAPEGASNLFYYLFEDYAGALPVLKESQRTLKLLVCLHTHDVVLQIEYRMLTYCSPSAYFPAQYATPLCVGLEWWQETLTRE